MSATSIEEIVPARRKIAAGSTEPQPTSHVVRVLHLSSETLQKMSFAQPTELWASLEKNVARDATTGRVTCVFAQGKGKSWTFESPTFRADAFQPTGILDPTESLITNIRCAPSSWYAPRSIVVRVSGLRTVTQRIAHKPGLLNSTDREQGASRLVDAKFAEAVALASKEWFEDGVESEFSRALSALLHLYKDAAIAPVETFLGSPSSNVEVAVEMAQWLGKVDHSDSHHYRRTLLEKILLSDSSSVRLRYGAAAGLATMNDPSSRPAVVEALNRERNRRLQYFLQLVVDQLERTRACLNS